MLIFVPGGPRLLSRDVITLIMAEGCLTLIQYLVIFRAIWQSGSLRCGSRWGAAAPGSFWVWECTPSSVYLTLLLSWTVNKKNKTKKSLCINIDRCQLGYFYHS